MGIAPLRRFQSPIARCRFADELDEYRLRDWTKLAKWPYPFRLRLRLSPFVFCGFSIPREKGRPPSSGERRGVPTSRRGERSFKTKAPRTEDAKSSRVAPCTPTSDGSRPLRVTVRSSPHEAPQPCERSGFRARRSVPRARRFGFEERGGRWTARVRTFYRGCDFGRRKESKV